MRIKDVVTEKAVSKKQQQFFGIVRAMQKGDMPKDGEAGKVAKDMKKSDVKDFASTKHNGLPKKKKKKESIGESQQLNEWVWMLPALATAVRVGGPAITRMLTSQGAKQIAKGVAKNSGKAAQVVGKTIIKNPGKSLAAYGGYKVFETVDEALEWLKSLDLGDLAEDIIIGLAKAMVKYSIPIAAIIAVLYGGKKLYDYMKDQKQEQPA